MTTIEDVAKLSGLSRTTVSRVINNHPYVAEEKRVVVLEAMKSLGYVPNSAARSLRNQKTGMLAVLVPRITNPFFSQLIETIEIAASEHGYQLIVCQTRYLAKKELDYLNLLKTKQIDGVILTSIENDWETITPFLKYGPIVICNEPNERANVPMVTLDHYYGGYIATKHLIEQGHKRIAYCCGEYKSSISRHRELGFLKALSESNLSFDEQHAFRNAISVKDGKEIFNRIKEMKSKPTAIFTGGDEVAVGILAEAKMHGWKVPEQLSVVGFDNQTITELVQPTITTVHQPIDQMGQKVVELLLEKIKSKTKIYRDVHCLPLELIIRESTLKTKPVYI
jgi:LacI family transcriptional regulator, repressor for deo operon, udp, cdd, tsx, nupC, and nupG